MNREDSFACKFSSSESEESLLEPRRGIVLVRCKLMNHDRGVLAGEGVGKTACMFLLLSATYS